MAHIKCHSYITGRDVKYSLIGVKLKHKVKQEDYGTSVTNNNISYWNTSPSGRHCYYVDKAPYEISGINDNRAKKFMYTTTGLPTQGYNASGELEVEYDNHNTGTNPFIASSTYNINDFESGLNTRDLFETDTIKIVLEVVKCKISETVYKVSEFEGIDEDIDIIFKVYIKYILKASSTVIGIYDFGSSVNRYLARFPITFSINSELWNIKDFNPKYKSDMYYSNTYGVWLTSSKKKGSDINGLYVDGVKSENIGNFVGASFTMLCSECWGNVYYKTNEFHKFKITKDNKTIKNSVLRPLANKAGILYYRNMINTEPNKFITLSSVSGNKYIGTWNCETPKEHITWANNVLNTEGYELKSDAVNTSLNIFNEHTFVTTPILMPCINPTTFECAGQEEEGMFISLTNNILEGPAPDQEPDEEPEDPETTESADNPETDYTPPESDGDKEFDYGDFPVMDGLDSFNVYNPSYSNFIFKKYYKTSSDEEDSNDIAINFIEDSCNPSWFELWGATFKLAKGHPTPGEIISRVYYLPFEYNEIVGDSSANIRLAAPTYGPIGALTLGAKKHSENPNAPGEPILDNVHYYAKLTSRFEVLELGETNIARVFNNYLDFTHTSYKLTLPYGAGILEIEPDYLFLNGRSNGNILLRGILDLDTGELTIRVDVNRRLYHETVVNVAVDRLASIEDKMAVPLAIAKMSLGAGMAAGGMAKFFGGKGQSFDSNITYDMKNTQEINKLLTQTLDASGEQITELRSEIAKLKGGKK